VVAGVGRQQLQGAHVLGEAAAAVARTRIEELITDPRIGTDAQSERIYELIFDALLRRDDHFNVLPGLAERWENPDPLTYVFHLRHGVRFHDGRPLTSKDVKWTFDSLLNGSIRSPKSGTYKSVARVEAPYDSTVVFHLKEPYVSLLWNLSEGAVGIVPYGSGADFNRHPIGSGPFAVGRSGAGRRPRRSL